jgi:hypothetical protein
VNWHTHIDAVRSLAAIARDRPCKVRDISIVVGLAAQPVIDSPATEGRAMAAVVLDHEEENKEARRWHRND